MCCCGGLEMVSSQSGNLMTAVQSFTWSASHFGETSRWTSIAEIGQRLRAVVSAFQIGHPQPIAAFMDDTSVVMQLVTVPFDPSVEQQHAVRSWVMNVLELHVTRQFFARSVPDHV